MAPKIMFALQSELAKCGPNFLFNKSNIVLHKLEISNGVCGISNTVSNNFVESNGEKVSENKPLEIKTLVKSPRTKCHCRNKVVNFIFLRLVFPVIILGLPK